MKIGTQLLNEVQPLKCWVTKDGIYANNYRIKDAIKLIPGARWDKKAKAWALPRSPTTARALARLSESTGTPLQVGSEFGELLAKSESVVAGEQYRAAEDLPPLPGTTYPGWLHQRQAFWFCEPKPAAMVEMVMGWGGKSLVAIALAMHRRAKLTLICAPKVAIGVWPLQFETHVPPGSPWAPTVVPLRNGSVTARAAEAAGHLDRAVRTNRPLVLVTNYDASWRAAMYEVLESYPWDMIVADEIHRIKSSGGKASTRLAELAQQANYRLGLTGTLIPHSPLDVFGEYRFLDPGIYGESFYSFRARYAVLGGFDGKQVLDFQNLDDLHTRFRPITYFPPKEIKAQIHDPTDTVVPIELTTSRKYYNELDEKFVTEVNDGTVTPANAGVRLLRLQQLTGGHLKDDEGNIHQVGNEKETALRDFLEDVNEPVVVFARFIEDLNAIQRAAQSLNRTYGEISGRRKDLTKDSKMPEGIDIMGTQIQAGGISIDLTRARIGIYYSVGYSLGDYQQSRGRLHRPGQMQQVAFYHLVGQHTKDEAVYKALERREDVVRFLLRGMTEVVQN